MCLQHHAPVAHPYGAPGQHVVVLLDAQRLGAHHARLPGDASDGQGDDDVLDASTEYGRDDEGQGDHGYGHHGIDQTHDDGVDPTAEEAGQQTQELSDDGPQSDRADDRPDSEVRAP